MTYIPNNAFPKIIDNIHKTGRTTVHSSTLKTEIINTIGIFSDESIAKAIKLMEALGYIVPLAGRAGQHWSISEYLERQKKKTQEELDEEETAIEEIVEKSEKYDTEKADTPKQ